MSDLRGKIAVVTGASRGIGEASARAKGLTENVVVFRHALRNVLIPVVTLVGLQAPLLIGGSVILERIFVVPGMGSLLL